MKQFALVQNLLEMAAKKTCPTCGHGMSGYHYWYKGAWKCKSASLANPNITAAQSNTSISNTTSVDQTPIKQFLNANRIQNYTIEDDGTVNVTGDVLLNGIKELPIQFGRITGHFVVDDVSFKTFKGFPKVVGGDVRIQRRVIVPDYTGFPEVIRGAAAMKTIQADSLKGFPKLISKYAEITVSGNRHDLNDLGKFGAGLYINVEDAPLSNLNGLQRTFNDDLTIKAKGVSSLEGFPAEVNGNITLVVNTKAGSNPTKSMHKHIKKMSGVLHMLIDTMFELNDKSNIPPLLSTILIKGIKGVRFADSSYGMSLMTPMGLDLERAINNGITGDLDVHEFQDMLMDAGFGVAAKL